MEKLGLFFVGLFNFFIPFKPDVTKIYKKANSKKKYDPKTGLFYNPEDDWFNPKNSWDKNFNNWHDPKNSWNNNFKDSNKTNKKN